MGCDIHFIIEQKVKDKWLGVFATDKSKHNDSLLGRRRDYDFFNRLAGVRCEKGEFPLNHPKPYPNDLSDLSRLIITEWEADGHSHSYFSIKEFCDLYNKDRIRREKIVLDDSYDILGIDDDGDNFNPDEWRIVIFFVN